MPGPVGWDRFVVGTATTTDLTAVAAVGGATALAGTMLKPEAVASVNLGASLTAYSQSASLIIRGLAVGEDGSPGEGRGLAHRDGLGGRPDSS